MFQQFLQQSKEKLNELKTDLLKYKSKEFLDASMAGSALVAFADGSISSEEKQKMIAFVQNNEALSVYDTSEIIKSFQGFIETLEFDRDVGEANIMKAVGKMRNKPEEARLIVRMVIAIGASDGNFDESEKNVARQIINELSLNPSDFGL